MAPDPVKDFVKSLSMGKLRHSNSNGGGGSSSNHAASSPRGKAPGKPASSSGSGNSKASRTGNTTGSDRPGRKLRRASTTGRSLDWGNFHTPKHLVIPSPRTPREVGVGGSPAHSKMGSLPEGEDHHDEPPTPGSSTSGGGGGAGSHKAKGSKAARGRSASSVSSASVMSVGTSSWASGDAAREMEQLREELEEERIRAELLAERKTLLAAEAKRARAERDELAREQGRLTEVVSDMEGQMLDLKARYEAQLLALRKKMMSSKSEGPAAGDHLELVEEAEGLVHENEELREQLGDSVRSAKLAFAEKEGARAKTAALEREVGDLRAEGDAKEAEWGRVRARLEDMLQEAAEEAGRRAQEASAARREAAEVRLVLEEVSQELRGRLAAAEAQIKHQAFSLASALERAGAAEEAKEQYLEMKMAAAAGEGGDWVEQMGRLELEVSRLVTRLAEKDVELRRERGFRELAETEHGEIKEAMEAQAELIRDKMKAMQREKDAAQVSTDRRLAAMQREITLLLDQKEAHQNAARKARASAERAEEYLKALDVARVEVKRLRLERDLLQEKISSLESSKGSVVDVSWLLPECLTHCPRG